MMFVDSVIKLMGIYMVRILYQSVWSTIVGSTASVEGIVLVVKTVML